MNNRVVLFIALGLVVAFVGVGAMAYYVTNVSAELADRPFTSHQWQHGSEHDRGSMVRRLQSGHQLDDKTRAEVEELLGPPDRDTKEALYYKVAFSKQMGSTSGASSLAVVFDEDGLVASTELRE